MSTRHDRMAVLNLIAEHRVMDLFATADADVACRVADAIAAGGGRIIEFTNRVPFAPQVFEKLRRHLDTEHPNMALGVGSVEDPATAVNFMALGAEFIVSPIFLPETADVCNLRKIPYLPGTQTLTEMATAERSGVEYLKLYPASDPAIIRSAMMPRPWSRIIANGQISVDNVGLWLEAGAAGIGTMMTVPPAAIESGDYAKITTSVAEMIERVRSLS